VVTEGAVYHLTQTEGPCMSEPATMVLTVLPVPTDAQLAAPDEVCAGSELVLELTGSGALSGTWSTPVGTYSGPALSFSSATTEYDGTYVVVPFIGPCAGDTLMHQVVVLVPQAPDLGNDTSFCTGGWTTLEVPPGFTEPVWSTGATSASIIVDQPGTYGLSVLDAQGCAVYDEVLLDVVDCDPQLPNAITPNGDGQNDGWSIEPWTVRSAQLSVFNRFGALVWEGDPTTTAFTGIHGTSGEPLAEGAYFYALRLIGTDGSAKDHTGYLQLLR
jgi:gliding motility-associated-like protein